MNIHRLKHFCILFFSGTKTYFLIICILAFISVWLSGICMDEHLKRSIKSFEINDDIFRKMDMSGVDFDFLPEASGEYDMEPYELILLSMYYNLDIKSDVHWDKGYLWMLRNRTFNKNSDFLKATGILKDIINDMKVFPVAISTKDIPFVEYIDSWQFERTFGGRRLHEGCDIMALKNERGLYPVISVCDGTIEKKGWLLKGGYRVGIRSDSGVYYYYAHLSEYTDIYEGMRVKAGEIIGFMGDTGYGEEGTTGMFDVHLHFGIYINDANGNEISLNPYWFLKMPDNNFLYFEY